MHSPITIRLATIADAPAVLRCLHTAFAPYRDQYSSAAFADTVLDPETLRLRMEVMSILVALAKSGEIVGTVAYQALDTGTSEKKDGHMRGMAVLPNQQGQGVAGLLLRAAESELRVLGCSRITLDTTAPLHRAIRFYENNGFVQSGVVADFFGMPLYEYTKELSDGST